MTGDDPPSAVDVVDRAGEPGVSAGVSCFAETPSCVGAAVGRVEVDTEDLWLNPARRPHINMKALHSRRTDAAPEDKTSENDVEVVRSYVSRVDSPSYSHRIIIDN
jgi:acetaldehyde dehydrogenase (acetylating)